MSKEPVTITVDLDDERSIRDQIDTPENREALAEVVRDALGIEGGTGEAHAPDGSLWAEMGGIRPGAAHRLHHGPQGHPRGAQQDAARDGAR